MLADNIRNRRIELGLSQRELAERLGYKSTSTIAKIESGVNDIPQSKMADFAKALNTTISKLMGIESHSTDLPPEWLDEATEKMFLDIINTESGKAEIKKLIKATICGEIIMFLRDEGETELIKKYRLLDEGGKDRIHKILDFEIYQMINSAQKRRAEFRVIK